MAALATVQQIRSRGFQLFDEHTILRQPHLGEQFQVRKPLAASDSDTTGQPLTEGCYSGTQCVAFRQQPHVGNYRVNVNPSFTVGRYSTQCQTVTGQGLESGTRLAHSFITVQYEVVSGKQRNK